MHFCLSRLSSRIHQGTSGPLRKGEYGVRLRVEGGSDRTRKKNPHFIPFRLSRVSSLAASNGSQALRDQTLLTFLRVAMRQSHLAADLVPGTVSCCP